MKRKKSNKKLKNGGLRDAAGRWKIEKNVTNAVLWKSAQRGAKDAQNMRYQSFVDTDSKVRSQNKERPRCQNQGRGSER